MIPNKPRLRPQLTTCKLQSVNSAILVAAGQGARMGAGTDKLFLEVAGRPVVAHTWQRFNDAGCIGDIILVVRDGMQKASPNWRQNAVFKNRFTSSLAGRSGRIRFGTVWRRCRRRPKSWRFKTRHGPAPAKL